MAGFIVFIRRWLAVGGFAAATALTVAIPVLNSPSPTINTPLAACPHGEDEDPFTFTCVPELVPRNSNGPSERDLEQDVYDTPGFTSPNVGGTTVP
jgi:hypothetical protein